MSTTAGSVLRDAAVAACQGPAVAAAAGLSAGVWADVNAPHVFGGNGGFIGGRNRGRLPFVEVSVIGQTFTPVTSEQDGDLEQTLSIRCHVGGDSIEDAEDLSELIISTCLVAIRNLGSELAAVGSDRVSGLDQGPWGHVREATISVMQNYHRDTYEVI